MSRIPASTLVVLGWCASGAACGGGGAREGPTPPDTPVLLIVIDTLRADHLSCYGYELETSPVVDEFAAGATLFEHNTTQCNATFPSITSILTGLYPKTHRNYLAVPVAGTVGATPGATCLAERFQAAGYHTLANISHPSWSGADEDATVLRGWDDLSFLDGGTPLMERVRLANAAHTNERLFAQLDRHRERAADRPLFAWAHYFDPHTDLPSVYEPPEVTRNLFLAQHLRGTGAESRVDELAQVPPSRRRAWIRANLPEEQWRPVELANGCALYDAEIRFCDSQIGALFERWKAAGDWDRSLIVLMADHGENLESADRGHGPLAFTHKKLYESVAHTPLIVKLPHQRVGRRVEVLTQNIDLVPTLVDLLRLEKDPPVEGRSLAALLAGGDEAIHEAVFIESSDYVDRAVKTPEWKYIDRGEEQPELVYAWRDDPGESVDLALQIEPSSLERLRAAIAAFRPVDVLHVELEPGSTPSSLEIVLDLERSLIDGLSGVAPECVEEGGHRFRWSGAVGPEGVHAEIELRRRNTAMRWRMRDSSGAPLVERVYLGRAPLARTAAIPLWRAGAGEAPPDPELELRRDAGAGTISVALAASDTARFEVDVRYARPDYLKGVSVLQSAGFEPLREGRSRVFQLAGAGPAASAVCELTQYDQEHHVLARIDGRWPDLARVSIDGAALATEELAFVLPHPLDGRVTTDLMSGRDPEAPPGSITIWLEAAGGGGQIDTSRLDPEESRLLEQMGYAGEDEAEDDADR